MSKLENLVPPLELCQQIPEGMFEDSALVWMMRKSEDGFVANGTGFNGATGKVVLATREHAKSLKYNKGLIAEPVEFFPAPTLQEILIDLYKLNGKGAVCADFGFTWLVSHGATQTEDDNPATAALKVWLKVNGGTK